MEFMVLWLVCALIAGAVASSKGRSGAGWALLTFFLSPLMLILVAVLPRVEWAEGHDAAEYTTCPFCAEDVKWEAVVCKHCDRDLPDNEKPCRACGRMVTREEDPCPQCGIYSPRVRPVG